MPTVTPRGAINAVGIPPRYRKARAARGRFRKGRGQLFSLDLPLPASSLLPRPEVNCRLRIWRTPGGNSTARLH
jgi:hypothetical protein